MEDSIEKIQRACRLGDLDLLKVSLDSYPSGLNESDSKLGWTSLYRSVICGHMDIVDYLLKSGADPDLRTRMGDTALHQACENRQYKMVELLLQHNADPNIQQNDGETPLHISVIKNDAEMVEILLKNNASTNIKNFNFGKSPLHYAVEYGFVSIVSMLLKHNANPDLTDKFEKTSKDLAKNAEILNLLKNHCFYIPSPEPSEFPQKASIDFISPIFSCSNSDISFTSDYRTVETKVKQLEDIHKKIRETVRASVDTSRPLIYSINNSMLFEQDIEKSAYDIIVDKSNPVSFGNIEKKNSELFQWLSHKKLENCFETLVNAGYDDLAQISLQMQSKMPITEDSLEEIGIQKEGYRKRLMLGFSELIFSNKSQNTKKPNDFGVFRCCSVEINENLLVLNMPGLDRWLESLNLKEFHLNFVENGYDELEQMLYLVGSPWEIRNEDLVNIGINKTGHRHRILSKLKEDAWGLERKLFYSGLNNPKINVISASDFCVVT